MADSEFDSIVSQSIRARAVRLVPSGPSRAGILAAYKAGGPNDPAVPPGSVVTHHAVARGMAASYMAGRQQLIDAIQTDANAQGTVARAAILASLTRARAASFVAAVDPATP